MVYIILEKWTFFFPSFSRS